MNHYLRCFRLAAVLLIASGMGAGVARAQSIPSNLPGVVTRDLFFAQHDNDGLFYILDSSSSIAYAQGNGITYAPRLSQAASMGRTLWFHFINGAPGQYDLVTGDPGHPNYGPVAHVIYVQWRTTPVRLTSYKDVFTHANAGRLVGFDTGALLNASVIWHDTDLNGRGGHLATTLLPGVQVKQIRFSSSGTPDQVDLFVYPAYYNNRVVAFEDLDHADGQVPDANGNIVQVTPVPRISRSRIGGNAIATLYAVEGQDAVVNTVPGLSSYSPLWQIVFVSRQPGFTTLLTSEQAILAAQSAGRVTLQSGGDGAVFNCPIVDPQEAQPAS